MNIRAIFYATSTLVAVAMAVVAFFFWPPLWWSFLVIGPLVLLGIRDVAQDDHAVLRNFPVIGHFRYLFEMIRPEINQYFVESNTDGMPFNREMRSLVYQRAKDVTDTLPFGTQRDVYAEGYEWINHSLAPCHPVETNPRVVIGAETCKHPYSASLLNISAMSFGSLSKNAILALNAGAKRGGFAHNTGEGGVSPYHLEPGGDLIWQIGTGYFGCRANDGGFDPAPFQDMAQRPNIKMIELKLSQGAKPGHGGILPARKVTEEIARIRLVPRGRDVLSPPSHSAFDGPKGLLEFLAELRELCGGKPVGFKLCVGRKREFLAICKAMIETGLYPDFISVDGGEGGTGAAPLEFSNSMGMPLNEGLVFVCNALVGCDLRDKIKVGAAGKIITGFNLASKIALGADFGGSARGMMFALGCIQALRCNTNECPVGVATQRPGLVAGLVPGRKEHRVANYHRQTIETFVELLGAAGCTSVDDLEPWQIFRRVSSRDIRHYAQIYDFVEPGALLSGELPRGFARSWAEATSDRF